MLSFCYVNKGYVDYLRTVDRRVPRLDYDSNDKFFCGVVLKVNGIHYYAPVSHDTTRQRTSFLILDKGKLISSVKFAFMIPVPEVMLTVMNFDEIKDRKYADLVRAEYRFCSTHESAIETMASRVYRISCNKNHILNKVVCDFKALEAAMEKYEHGLTT